ncbi:MAG: hypothetical protein QHH14_02670 [Clostridiales bacterium]|nr:hypothetical protein [Clostridiales bacterium]
MARKVLICLILTVFCLAATGFCQPKEYGLGLVVIEPTGLTGKAWLNRRAALDAAIGWSAKRGHFLHIHVDYLFYRSSFHSDTRVDFSLYIGAGGKIIFQDNDNAWLRFPLGIDFLAKTSPLNIFFEVVPTSNFSRLDLLGAIGIRYTFRR